MPFCGDYFVWMALVGGLGGWVNLVANASGTELIESACLLVAATALMLD